MFPISYHTNHSHNEDNQIDEDEHSYKSSNNEIKENFRSHPSKKIKNRIYN